MHVTKKTRLLTSIVTFLSFVDTNILIPVIALYAASLGAGTGIIGVIVGLYSLTNFLTNLLGGRLTDRFGFKRPLLGGLAGDAIALLLYSFCYTPLHLALVRAFHGFSGGLAGPATMAATGQMASREGRGKAMSYYGIAIACATLVGHGAGGTIATRLGYHYVFYTGATLLLAGVIAGFFLPSGKAGSTRRYTAGGFKGMLRLIAAQRNLSVSYLSVFAQYFSFGGVVALLPLYVTSLGMEAFHVGMVLIIFSIAFILVQIAAGGLSDRIGRLRPTAIALGILIVALASLPLANSFLTLGVVMALYGAGYGMLFPAISAILTDSAPASEYGRVTGIFHALITIGVAVGAPVIGWIAAAAGLRTGLGLTFIILVPALALTLLRIRSFRPAANG